MTTLPIALPRSGAAPRAQAGISLIEMLIALLVLSFGLLGLAGLQAYSLRNNSGAYYRSIANSLAYDIVDRMRANRAVALAAASNYNITLATNKPEPSATDVRQQDQFEWLTAIETLPGGDGSIGCDSTTGVCQVRVQWDDSRGAGGTGPDPDCDDSSFVSGSWVCLVYSTEI